MRALTLVLLALVLFACGCDKGTRSCTLIGCDDGAGVALSMSEDMLTDGEYAFAFTFRGEARTCTLRVPDDVPMERGRSLDLPCDGDFGALLEPAVVCTEQRTSDAIFQTCEPVPRAWKVTTGIEGVVDSLRIEVQRDGQSIFDRTVEPAYRSEQPNGPDCEPTASEPKSS